jgi:hypothetical protein
MSEPDKLCDLCGHNSRRTCGLLAHAGICGLPDPRKRLDRHGADAATVTQHKPMDVPDDHPMAPARRALAALVPCGAHARQTGHPCKRPPCRGSTRCNLHGGRSTGPRPTSGRRTLERQRMEHYLYCLLRVIADTNDRPEPVDVETALPDAEQASTPFINTKEQADASIPSARHRSQ